MNAVKFIYEENYFTTRKMIKGERERDDDDGGVWDVSGVVDDSRWLVGCIGV